MTASRAPASSQIVTSFARENWSTLDSNPDRYIGSDVDIVGRVLGDVGRDGSGTYWQMLGDSENSIWNIVVGYPDPSFKLKEDQFVHIFGTVSGEFSGENAFGGTVIAVEVAATRAQVVDAVAAASAAVRTVRLNARQTQHGITILLRKVEFAEDQTRAFITVRNGSNSKAYFYSFDAKALQGSKQFDSDTPYAWPEIPTDLLRGVKASGVIAFPAMNPDRATKFLFEASSDNFYVDFQPYVFRVRQ